MIAYQRYKLKSLIACSSMCSCIEVSSYSLFTPMNKVVQVIPQDSLWSIWWTKKRANIN